MATMEDQYNKKSNQGALIGNWVEERALKADTGEPRYRQWEDSIGEDGPRDDSGPQGPTQRWTKGGEKADQNDSFGRCFLHDDRDDYSTVKSFNETSYENPKNLTGNKVTREYRAVGEGAKARLTQQEMWDLASKAAEEQAEQENQNILDEPLVSTQQEAFQAPPPGAYKKVIGSRVMRTRDGRDIPNDTRDITFLRETGIRGPDTRLDYKDVSNEKEENDLYKTEAISFYTAAPAIGGTQGFAGRTGQQNFRKSSKYSVPIEYSREVEKE